MCGQVMGESPAVAPPWRPPDPSQIDSSYRPAWAGTGAPSQRDVDKASRQLRWAWLAIAFVGSVNVGLAFIAQMRSVRVLQQQGFAWGAAIEGGIYLVLAFFIWRWSLIALGIATVLLLFDAAVTLLVLHRFGGLLLRAAILYAVYQGFHALDALKKHHAAEAASDQLKAA